MEGYELEPLDATARPAAAPPLPAQVEKDRPCVICSYNLRGLDTTSRCPECGTSVERSLKGDLLYFSSPHYLANLIRGATLVVVGSVAEVLLIVLYVAAVFAMYVINAPGDWAALELAANWASALFTILIAVGWWLFSTPDPAIISTNTGTTPRKIVRITGVASAAGAIAVVAIEQSLTLAGTSADAFSGAASSLGGLAKIALYFSSLLYIAWIAKRIPDPQMHDDAKRLMWLGPLLYILLACIVIGPLIAWTLYILLLNQLRMSLRTVLQEMDPP